MRDARSIFTACAVAMALTAAGAGARSYRAMSARSLELERQNASLMGGYDELRGGYIECLVREEEGIVAATYAGLVADPNATSDARHRREGELAAVPSVHVTPEVVFAHRPR